MAPWLEGLLVGLCVGAAAAWLAWRAWRLLRAPAGPAGGAGCGCTGKASCGSPAAGDGGVRHPPAEGAATNRR